MPRRVVLGRPLAAQVSNRGSATVGARVLQCGAVMYDPALVEGIWLLSRRTSHDTQRVY